MKRTQNPGSVEISGLLFLPSCEVSSNYRYTLYGKGFASGDKIKFESLTVSDRSYTLDTTVSSESVSVRIPDSFSSDRYRMVLLRGQAQYPLGIAEFTFTENPVQLTKPRVIAHRGFHTEGAPENSVEALAAAQELGVYGSELDVWITSDGRLVVNHDKTFEGDSHVIENSTYDQIKNLTLSNGEKVPTLDDFLEQAAKSTTTKLIVRGSTPPRESIPAPRRQPNSGGGFPIGAGSRQTTLIS